MKFELFHFYSLFIINYYSSILFSFVFTNICMLIIIIYLLSIIIYLLSIIIYLLIIIFIITNYYFHYYLLFSFLLFIYQLFFNINFKISI